MTIRSICLLGFGEVGQRLFPALAESGCELWSFDQQFGDADSKPSLAAAELPQLQRAANAAQAAARVDLVISAVTAEQSLAAATAAAAGLRPSTWFLDLNSVSPATRMETAAVVEKTGARYVEAAVMGPIAPQGIATAILLGGPWARHFEPLAMTLGFTGASAFHSEIGKAAATKMCRSVLIKGLESLLSESLLTARHYGVEDTVIDSLSNLMPGVNWKQHSAYMISRSLEHGIRRAEEMCEAARTVQGAGLEPLMSRACAETQLWCAQFGAALQHRELGPMLDDILRLKNRD